MASQVLIEVRGIMGFLERAKELLDKNIEELKTELISKRSEMDIAKFDTIRNKAKEYIDVIFRYFNLEELWFIIEFGKGDAILPYYKKIINEMCKKELFYKRKDGILEYLRKIVQIIKKESRNLDALLTTEKIRASLAWKTYLLSMDFFGVLSILATYIFKYREKRFPKSLIQIVLFIYERIREILNSIRYARDFNKIRNQILQLKRYISEFSLLVDYVIFYGMEKKTIGEEPNFEVLPNILDREVLRDLYQFLLGLELPLEIYNVNEVTKILKDIAGGLSRPSFLVKKALNNLIITAVREEHLPGNFKVHRYKNYTYKIYWELSHPLFLLYTILELNRYDLGKKGIAVTRNIDIEFKGHNSELIVKIPPGAEDLIKDLQEKL